MTYAELCIIGLFVGSVGTIALVYCLTKIGESHGLHENLWKTKKKL